MTATLREELIRVLPYARRYARALTRSRSRGDELVADSLKAVLADAPREPACHPKLALYGAVTRCFGRLPHDANELGLTAQQRQLLLLTALEDVPVDLAADIVALPLAEASTLLAEARDQLRASAATDVLIIEDEPIIAMDIEELVAGCGHRVIGTASTEAEALEIATRERPGLILADINLGAGGDGAHAVARILKHLHAPVIFVTAYPERLLTGDALEPAFVITKPFEPLTLAVATYQAVHRGQMP